MFICREQFFFQGKMFLYFTKVAAAIHSSMVKVFLKEHLQPLRIHNVFDRYFKDIELTRVFCCSHPFDE